MTVSEVVRLFAFVALIDPRLAGDEAKARAWLEVLHPNMTYEAALEAVKLHYARSAFCVMPAHLNELFVAAGNRQDTRRIESAPGVPMPDNVRALVRGSFKKVPNDYE